MERRAARAAQRHNITHSPKATKHANGKAKFDPTPHQNRLTYLHKNWQA